MSSGAQLCCPAKLATNILQRGVRLAWSIFPIEVRVQSLDNFRCLGVRKLQHYPLAQPRRQGVRIAEFVRDFGERTGARLRLALRIELLKKGQKLQPFEWREFDVDYFGWSLQFFHGKTL